jgi:hypothetical protein
MPINYPTFGQATLGAPDLINALNKGYQSNMYAAQASNLPKQMAAELLAKNLQSRLKQNELQYAPQMSEAMLQGMKNKNALFPLQQELMRAQTQRALRPSQGSNGISISTDANGKPVIQIGGSGSNQIEQPGSLPKGQNYIYDKNTNEPIGIGRQLSPTELKEETGRAFFNQVYPIINKGLSTYSGKGSNIKFKEDSSRYNTDPQAKQRIDSYILAKKLLSAGVVKENATIGGANTNRTYQQLRESLDSSDIFPLLETYAKQYEWPAEAFESAGNSLKNALENATVYANEHIPAQRVTYFNPKPEQKNVVQEKDIKQKNNDPLGLR